MPRRSDVPGVNRPRGHFHNDDTTVVAATVVITFALQRETEMPVVELSGHPEHPKKSTFDKSNWSYNIITSTAKDFVLL